MGIYRQAGCVCAHPEHQEKLALSCMLCKCGDWRGLTCTSVIEMREKSMREDIKADSKWISKRLNTPVMVVTTTALSVIYTEGKGKEYIRTTRDFLESYRKSGFEIGKTYEFSDGILTGYTWRVFAERDDIFGAERYIKGVFNGWAQFEPEGFSEMTEV
jgi:hypothetical protein